MIIIKKLLKHCDMSVIEKKAVSDWKCFHILSDGISCLRL